MVGIARITLTSLFLGGILISLFFTFCLAGEGEGDVIVISREEIQAMKAHKMADLLNHVPGVSAGDSSVSIHGSYKVKVLVNGRPLNDPTSSYGRINWEMVSPDQVERLEIHRGKGGLKYGQDASGGVILVTTRTIDSLTGNIKAYGGNFGTRYGYAGFQKSVGRWGFSATGGKEQSDGYKINNDKSRWQAGTKIDYTLGKNHGFAFTADYLDDQRGLSGQPEYPTPFSRKLSRNTALSLQARIHGVTATGFFNEGFNHNTDSSRNLDKALRVKEFGQDIASTFDMESWGKLNVGGACYLGRASGSSFQEQEERGYSFFVVHSSSWPGSPFSLSMGLRANVNSDFDDAVNPELKLTWKRDPWSITASYARSNNTPSFYRRYYQSSTLRSNPDLDMETADNYSLAFFWEPRESFTGSISFFYNRLSDRITYVADDDGTAQYRNFGLVTYVGGDLAASFQPVSGIKINASYTYLEAVDEDQDKWLTSKPRHKARMDIYWQPQFTPLTLVLATKSVSKVYRNRSNTKTDPGYTISDLRVEYPFSRFNLFGEVRNLFDKTYYYADGLLAPPLTWFFGVNWKI